MNNVKEYPLSAFTGLASGLTVQPIYLKEEVSGLGYTVEAIYETYDGQGAHQGYGIRLAQNIADWSGYDAAVAAHEGRKLLTLDEYKKDKLGKIKDYTEKLIEQGFTFDGEVFGLDVKSRTIWIGLYAMHEDADTEIQDLFPITITTKADTDYSLTKANVRPFYKTALGTIKAWHDSARTMHASVIAATTKAEVDAVVDNRS